MNSIRSCVRIRVVIKVLRLVYNYVIVLGKYCNYWDIYMIDLVIDLYSHNIILKQLNSDIWTHRTGPRVPIHLPRYLGIRPQTNFYNEKRCYKKLGYIYPGVIFIRWCITVMKFSEIIHIWVLLLLKINIEWPIVNLVDFLPTFSPFIRLLKYLCDCFIPVFLIPRSSNPSVCSS